MDTAPPQAPPAIVSDVQQHATDSLNRLLDTHAWLGSWQQSMPALPARYATADRAGWINSLDAFWQQPVESVQGAERASRIELLSARLAQVMRDETIVRQADGTLPADAAELALRFARSSGAPMPGVDVRSLRIGDTDYAGAVVLVDSTRPALVLRFLPDRGWDTFDSLDRLHAQTEETFRQALATQFQLPGVRADDTQQVLAAQRFVSSRLLEGGNVFVAMASRIAALQKQKLEDAWPSGEAATSDAPASPAFIDEAGAALDIQGVIDIPALLAEAQARVARSVDAQRLANVPAEVAQGWHAALAGLQLAREKAGWSARQHPDDAPLSLDAWCRKELAAALRTRGVTSEPDDIEIGVAGDEAIARMSLSAFALHNSGYLDGRTLTVIRAPHTAGGVDPGITLLRSMVRELNLAPRYDAYIRSQLHAPATEPFRTATMELQQARMRAEAANARIASFRSSEPTAFIDDHEERGYRLVEAVLNAPAAAGRAKVGGHDVAVHQLTYRGAVVSDVLVISVSDPRSAPRVVLYTPDAPDGRSFREFSDRATAARLFLYAPAFEAYLLQRLPMEYGEPLPSGSGRRFRVSETTRRAHWALAAPSESRGTLTEEPFSEQRIEGDIRSALFDAEIVRQARDVAWAGRSTQRADAASVAAFLDTALRGLRGPASAIEDTAGAVGQALRATWRFYDSVKAGDQGQAFIDFTEAYTSSLALAGWHTGRGRVGGPMVSVRVPATAQAARAQVALARRPALRARLDTRYATPHVDLRGTRPDATGVYRLNGRRYVRQHDHVFEVRHDASAGTWRLARPNALDAAFPGPAIEPLAAGGWRVRTDVGLRGGWVDDAAFPQPRTRAATQQELAGLTEFQRWMFEQSFRARLRNSGEASIILWDITSRAEPRYLTLRQRTAWNDALRQTRNGPREPVAAGAVPPPGASWRVLPPSEWPTSLWHYPDGYHGFIGHDGSRAVPLQVVPGSGLRGLPATIDTPVARVGTVSTGNVPGARAQEWLQLHLDRYRGRTGPGGQPVLRVIEDRRGGEVSFVVQPGPGLPQNFFGLEPGDFTAGRQALP